MSAAPGTGSPESRKLNGLGRTLACSETNGAGDGPREASAENRIDDDFRHLLGSWFNRGFLVMRPIDWQSPAAILEKIIAYGKTAKRCAVIGGGLLHFENDR